MPIAGNVTAQYINSFVVMSGTASASTAVAGSSTTCYDNGNSTANPVTYSVTQNNGAGGNCGLSFKFQ